MNQVSSPKDRFASRAVTMFLACVIMSSIVGYFVGIRSGSPRAFMQPDSSTNLSIDHEAQRQSELATEVLLATNYDQMRRRESGPTSHWTASLSKISQQVYDPLAEIKPSEEDKLKSLQERSALRAFNGAPPIIPHAVLRTTDAACYACHGEGLRIEDRVARRMSHGFLANCTQCHAPPAPQPFESLDLSVDNSFTGAKAPVTGQRAFPGAPPVIPHSTWMRGECLACHGGATGWSGMESTHPWRTSCQQCHAPSAVLDQAIVQSESEFLPPSEVSRP